MHRLPTCHSDRLEVLDAARGVAVLAMVFMHLVATEGGSTGSEAATACLARLVHGKGAVLFAVLAGMTWSLQSRRGGDDRQFGRYILRRSLSLGLAGAMLGRLLWPTEILSPLALMLPVVVWLDRAGTRAVVGGTALLLIAAPLLRWLFGDLVATDWFEDGSHLADSTFGWATLRYYLFDGNYPLVPWAALPLFGVLLLRGRALSPPRARALFLLALPLAVALHASSAWVEANRARLGGLAEHLTSEWTPTTIPFVLVGLSWATAVIAGFAWLAGAGWLPWRMLFLQWLGRASLTHYLLHLGTVVLVLKQRYPEEDWSIRTGLWGFATYVAVAAPLSWLWFRRCRRGPCEALWAMASGRLGEARGACDRSAC